MAHLTMQQLHWSPLDVKLSSIPCQKIANTGIKEEKKGFSVGPALHHYHCIQEIDRKKSTAYNRHIRVFT